MNRDRYLCALLAAIALMGTTAACDPPGVGDPCTPEVRPPPDPDAPGMNQPWAYGEVSVETRSLTRLGLTNAATAIEQHAARFGADAGVPLVARNPVVTIRGGGPGGGGHEVDFPYGTDEEWKHVFDGLLTSGRCISAAIRTADNIRLIPVCFATGHAAGVAAAVAAKDGCTPREVEVPKVQAVLKQQEAYLG